MSVDGVYETDADVEHYFYSYTHPTLGRQFQRVPKRGVQFGLWRVTPVRLGDLADAIFTMYARPGHGGPMASTMVAAEVDGKRVTIGAGFELLREPTQLQLMAWACKPAAIPPQHDIHWQEDGNNADLAN